MKYDTKISVIVSATIMFVMFGTMVRPSPVSAVAATPTHTGAPTPSTTPSDSVQIDDLKERLATKVAELHSVVKRAMNGVVKSVSVASATVETDTKDIKIELGDNVKVAQMIRGKRTQLSTDDIAKDDPITVFGTYDATLDLLKAQYIFIENKIVLKHLSGTVSDTDPKTFTVTIKTREGREMTIDIQNSTKTSSWTKNGGIVKSGFSKIAKGDIVHVAGTQNSADETKINAQRILDIGDPLGTAPTATPTLEASPSASPTP